jgi:hypothetical protein
MPQIVRRWTEEEERTLLELKQLGKPDHVIAKILRRTEAAVANRIAQMKANGIYS